MRKILGRIKKTLGRLLLSQKEQRHSLVGPPQLWKMKREFQIDFLKKHGLLETHLLLDLGCGTLRGGLPIIEYLEVGHYFGVEVRPEVLQEANKELSEAGLIHKRPTLILLRDADSLPDHGFDFLWAFSVLIHMDDDTLRNALLLVRKRLADTGVCYANVSIGAGEEDEWQGFPVVKRSLEFYKKIADESGLTVVDLGKLGTLGHRSGIASQDAQHMLLFSVQKEAVCPHIP